MSRTYKATGINLKTQALGESDKIVTILTKEFGLIRAVAPGARKHNSSLGGRIGIFVVNELLISQGKSLGNATPTLDKITQAQTIKTYPGLTKDLGKLAASQYLAEIVLCQALSELPQTELYDLLDEHLQRLEALPKSQGFAVVAHLAHGVFQFLALAGLTPQVQVCCLTQLPVTPDWTNPNWQVGFSVPTGGIISLEAWKSLRSEREKGKREDGEIRKKSSPNPQSPSYETVIHQQDLPTISNRLNAKELFMLQYLSQTEIMQIEAASDYGWLSIEQILRQYIQYHLDRPIRSATLIDSYFAANHDAIV
ncbi:DNA repair protein RecO [Anabaena cylindrica FACHB-243]|uniref:DNA repair protein RecO n=1 Tax=Anabaena cylindrica (strain ATCC 27899 / PCC 7122) TaxID=272123 RepID=K9ZLT0_ANACC|nr:MULTISPECIES: DNA repair protein RecO [Anabaena]AFZ59280.1 DNA replication and repair protein RecO [Anabaena cylindrica PCC 7122]MBD2416861.1 DNA repair protein RecO [Anabaena cylindrica FACHB-243]MBY5280336.1 DNA repair protein RecO [Anabaena sp. CCAP 1446/1C]MBY5308321.1 DNA repair protein RecO [Anabaena sp. CCAP 1446/1C]MCM2405197.1 DNA repair protein RecO [Anabaena sp. CCAP 1446/1C]